MESRAAFRIRTRILIGFVSFWEAGSGSASHIFCITSIKIRIRNTASMVSTMRHWQTFYLIQKLIYALTLSQKEVTLFIVIGAYISHNTTVQKERSTHLNERMRARPATESWKESYSSSYDPLQLIGRHSLAAQTAAATTMLPTLVKISRPAWLKKFCRKNWKLLWHPL